MAAPFQIPYATVISTLAFAASVVYGIWALNQAQLANVAQQIEQLRKDTDAKDIRLSSELTRRETELKANITAIQTELAARRLEFIDQHEFKQFQERALDDIRVLRGQLTVLESTRPTTGELQAASTALRDRIDKIYAMLASQEDYLRRLHGTPIGGAK